MEEEMSVDAKMRDAMAVPTYKNTSFCDWWALLNAELAKLGLPEATFGTARDDYDFGHAPSTSAAEAKALAE